MRSALAALGPDGDEAALDIRDLCSLVDFIRLVRRTAMPAGIAIKLKIFGDSPLPRPIHQPNRTRPRGRPIVSFAVELALPPP